MKKAVKSAQGGSASGRKSPKKTVVAKKAAPKKAAPKAKAEPKPRKKAVVAEAVTQPTKPSVVKVKDPIMKFKLPAVSSLATATTVVQGKTRYSDEELEHFKGIIQKKLNVARQSLLEMKELDGNSNGTEDTDPGGVKIIEDGSETLAKEHNAQLAGRQERLVRDLEDALVRIKNRTYGICRVTKLLISKERLELVPHATTSVEGKTGKPVPQTQPLSAVA